MPATPRIAATLAGALVVALSLSTCSSTGGTDSESDSKGRPDSSKSDAPAGASGSDTDKAGTLARYADHTSRVYEDPASWLCRPDVDDICDGDLDATVVEADGSLTVQKWAADPDAPIDCFYVYPTISRDVTDFSDMDASDEEEGFAALNQVGRLGQECRVFAPIYRQRTLAGLAGLLNGPSAEDASTADVSTTVASTTVAADGSASSEAPDETTPLKDVLDAWKTYMAKDNNGRGVVLIGHSQGAAILSQLIRDEIDPNDGVREHLVAAYLAGWSVQVPVGKDIGGDFERISLCRNETQTGCVVTWSSYRSTSPPPAGAIFGRGTVTDAGQQSVAACNSPASLSGGSAEARSYFPANASDSILGALGAGGDASKSWVDPSSGSVTTRFVSTPGLVTVECAAANGINYLALAINADPADPRADDIGGELTPDWGMHLQDVNVVMGNIVDLVASQSDAYAKS